ncbi:MAG TPA: hypothetical protein PLS45_11535 [Bacillota bacterium]|nr:hypothetical protein [Bacillota bacterium]HPM00505.1 hypothetical protein [Bacillota bacterium]
MAYEEPSGLMGKPDNLEKFTAFLVRDIVIYIDNDILDKYLKDNKLHINIEGYGRQLFEIKEES